MTENYSDKYYNDNYYNGSYNDNDNEKYYNEDGIQSSALSLAQQTLRSASHELEIRTEVSKSLTSMLMDVEVHHTLEKEYVAHQTISSLREKLRVCQSELDERRALQVSNKERNRKLGDWFVGELLVLSVKLNELEEWKRRHAHKVEQFDGVQRQLQQSQETLRSLQRNISLNAHANDTVATDNTLLTENTAPTAITTTTTQAKNTLEQNGDQINIYESEQVSVQEKTTTLNAETKVDTENRVQEVDVNVDVDATVEVDADVDVDVDVEPTEQTKGQPSLEQPQPTSQSQQQSQQSQQQQQQQQQSQQQQQQSQQELMPATNQKAATIDHHKDKEKLMKPQTNQQKRFTNKKNKKLDFTHFQEDILLEIFAFLDAVEVIQAAQVNKRFYRKVNRMFENESVVDITDNDNDNNDNDSNNDNDHDDDDNNENDNDSPNNDYIDTDKDSPPSVDNVVNDDDMLFDEFDNETNYGDETDNNDKGNETKGPETEISSSSPPPPTNHSNDTTPSPKVPVEETVSNTTYKQGPTIVALPPPKKTPKLKVSGLPSVEAKLPQALTSSNNLSNNVSNKDKDKDKESSSSLSSSNSVTKPENKKIANPLVSQMLSFVTNKQQQMQNHNNNQNNNNNNNNSTKTTLTKKEEDAFSSSPLAASMASKLTAQELSVILSMTQKISLVTAEREDLSARLEGTVAVKEFLVKKVRDTEDHLLKVSKDMKELLQKTATDQEVISFLDGRAQELEKSFQKTEEERRSLQTQLASHQTKSAQKIRVIEDMLQFEREQLTNQEREWKNMKKVLVKEVKHCHAQIAALQAERDAYCHHNERLKHALLTLNYGGGGGGMHLPSNARN